jgi:hypothetical protein
MDKIPTAEEFLDSRGCNKTDEGWDLVEKSDLVEFAKLHVKVALEAAYDNSNLRIDDGEVEITNSYSDNVLSITVDKDSILNAYPEENIK